MNVPGYSAVDGTNTAGQVRSPSKDKKTKELLLWPRLMNSETVGIIPYPFLTSRRRLFLCAGESQ